MRSADGGKGGDELTAATRPLPCSALRQSQHLVPLFQQLLHMMFVLTGSLFLRLCPSDRVSVSLPSGALTLSLYQLLVAVFLLPPLADGGRPSPASLGGAAQLADFSVLADTSHRLHPPGRTHDEARALLSMAVLLENAQVRTGASRCPVDWSWPPIFGTISDEGGIEAGAREGGRERSKVEGADLSRVLNVE